MQFTELKLKAQSDNKREHVEKIRVCGIDEEKLRTSQKTQNRTGQGQEGKHLTFFKVGWTALSALRRGRTNPKLAVM